MHFAPLRDVQLCEKPKADDLSLDTSHNHHKHTSLRDTHSDLMSG
jgi:hypothetical protein